MTRLGARGEPLAGRAPAHRAGRSRGGAVGAIGKSRVATANPLLGNVFLGQSAIGAWPAPGGLAENEGPSSVPDMTDSAAGSGHMYLQDAAWGIAGGKSFAHKVGLSNAVANVWGWRQRSAANPTVQGVYVNAGGNGLLLLDPTIEPFNPSNWPSTASEDLILMLWQTAANGTDSTFHFVNLTTATVDTHSWTHAAFAANADDHMIVANDNQFPGAVLQYPETVYGFGVWDRFVSEVLLAQALGETYP